MISTEKLASPKVRHLVQNGVLHTTRTKQGFIILALFDIYSVNSREAS